MPTSHTLRTALVVASLGLAASAPAMARGRTKASKPKVAVRGHAESAESRVHLGGAPSQSHHTTNPRKWNRLDAFGQNKVASQTSQSQLGMTAREHAFLRSTPDFARLEGAALDHALVAAERATIARSGHAPSDALERRLSAANDHHNALTAEIQGKYSRSYNRAFENGINYAIAAGQAPGARPFENRYIGPEPR